MKNILLNLGNITNVIYPSIGIATTQNNVEQIEEQNVNIEIILNVKENKNYFKENEKILNKIFKTNKGIISFKISEVGPFVSLIFSKSIGNFEHFKKNLETSSNILHFNTREIKNKTDAIISNNQSLKTYNKSSNLNKSSSVILENFFENTLKLKKVRDQEIARTHSTSITSEVTRLDGEKVNINNQYVKIGILELDLVENHSIGLLSKEKIDDPNGTDKTFEQNHADIVAGIMAGKQGINRNAHVYSTHWKGVDLFQRLEWFLKNNVSLVNVSLGEQMLSETNLRILSRYYAEFPERLQINDFNFDKMSAINWFNSEIRFNNKRTKMEKAKIIYNFLAPRNFNIEQRLYTLSSNIYFNFPLLSDLKTLPEYHEMQKIYLNYNNSSYIFDYFSRKFGITFVFGSGNAEKYRAPLGNLAKTLNSIIVGSTTEANDELSKFSSFSREWNETNGVIVVSRGEYRKIYQSNKESIEGTSLSAPVITGMLAALIRENPHLHFRPHALKSILISAAQLLKKDVDTFNGSGNKINNKFGAGFVDYQRMEKALNNLRILNRNNFKYTRYVGSDLKTIDWNQIVERVSLKPGEKISISLSWLYNAGILKDSYYWWTFYPNTYENNSRKKIGEGYKKGEANVNDFDLNLYFWDVDKKGSYTFNGSYTSLDKDIRVAHSNDGYKNNELIRFENTTNKIQNYVIEIKPWKENFRDFRNDEVTEELALSYVINE